MTSQPLLTPVGRIVWGHPAKPTPKTDDNNQPVMKKDGSGQAQQWAFGLAIPKAEFVTHVWPVMSAEAATKYPQGVPNGFAWKYVDGDGMDNGNPPKPYSAREGYAGHYVLVVSTEAFAPAIFKFNGTTFDQFADIKRGDYVRVNLTFDCHTGRADKKGSRPGLYVNPRGIEFIAYGEEIFGGPDANEMFGGAPRPAALPPGASMTPVAPSRAPGMPGMPASAAPAAPSPTPAYTPPGMPAPAPSPTPAPAMGMPGALPSPTPQAPTVPAAAPVAAIPAGMPGMMPAPMPTASPSNPAPAPAHDFVANAIAAPAPTPAAPQFYTVQHPGMIHKGFDPQTGVPLYGYP